MDRDRFQSSFNSEPHLSSESGSFSFPVDTVPVNGVIPLPYLNVPLGVNDHPSSSMEIPHYRSTTSVISGLHQQHLSTGSTSSFMPSTYAQLVPCYNHYTIPDDARNLNPQVESGRSSIKRKSPVMPSYTDAAGNTNWYYNSGSSSDITVCADRIPQKPLLGSHQWHWDQNGSVRNYGCSSVVVPGEGSQRHVRTRHIHASQLHASSSGTHFSSNLASHFTQIGPSPDANGHWNHHPMPHVSHGRTPPGAAGPSHNSQSFMSSSITVSAEPNGSHHNIIPSRHVGTPLPTTAGISQNTSEGHNNSRQRVGPSHRSMACYPNPNPLFPTTSKEVGQSVSGAFSRNSRPLSINGGRAERNTRPRFSYGRYRPYPDENSSHGRWMSEGVLVMDQSSFYDHSNLYDQHREMRLDIDSMSYEELLALEERIGNVNTGVSEDMMPKCLTKNLHFSSEPVAGDSDEGSCAICLESYRDRDELGTLKCGHDYHAECIKKWLLLKNVCPICKAPALEDATKG